MAMLEWLIYHAGMANLSFPLERTTGSQVIRKSFGDYGIRT